ncbi:MAG TPA: peroxidase-related enzyme [Candidatus Bathyarchaeia archaeon]|nr:peroxidase-related enzyme [Candidatus Bathyarchaeia archaeon]
MAWIDVTGEERAEGLLKEAYERIKRALGRVIPYYRAYSVSPRLLHAHLDFYDAVGAPGALSKLRKEMIATAVSADNGCRHCTELHGGFLRKLTGDGELVRSLVTDPAAAALEGADRALIAYALKLTRTPRDIQQSDVEALRAAGLSEQEIFEAAFVTAYFNYTNRVAEGLGVEPER